METNVSKRNDLLKRCNLIHGNLKSRFTTSPNKVISRILSLVRFYFVKDWFNMSVSCAVGACQVYHVTEMTAASWRLSARLCCRRSLLVGEGRRTGGGHALKWILLRVFYLTDHIPILCSWSHGNFNSYLLSTSPQLFNISQMHDLSFLHDIETFIISFRFCRFFSQRWSTWSSQERRQL